MVSVIMLTYNHEEFIAQAIEGVLMQETSFPVKLYIADDASTDKTTNICAGYAAKYPGKIVHLLNRANLGPRHNYINALKTCDTKYIAHCEGDDYWTDPLKLQKQVDFLENNVDCSICWAKYKILNITNTYSDTLTDPEWVSIIEDRNKLDIDLDNIFNPYTTLTLTVMFKKEAINFRLYNKLKHSKDNAVYCMCLSKGKGAVINFYGGVYRLHQAGSFSGLALYNQRYSNYLNLNEIIRFIPGCRNSNLTSIRNSLLLQSFDLCIQNQRIAELPRLFMMLYNILLYCNTADRKNASHVLFKQMALLMQKPKISKG